MTLPEWATKQGDDFRAPQPIVVKVGGVAQDLTDPDWEYVAQARLRSDDTTVVDFDIDEDTGLLEDGKLVLILPRATTATMADGGWIVDVEVTNDTILGVGRKSSETFKFAVKADVTRHA